MSYKINWCSEEDFERLPYDKVSTAVGLYDKKTGEVFVRHTGNPLMDTFTVYHELEHAKGDDLGEHESQNEPGVYYKDFGRTMQAAAPLAAFIPGVGPLASAALGAGGTAVSQRNQSKQGNGIMQGVQQMVQPTMDQFNPSSAAPATSQVGGQGGGGIGGGLGAGTIAKVRELMQQRQSGFYSGRDAGAI